MSNYTKATNFASKDALPSGNPAKVVNGTEIDDEFNAIQTAVNTKADLNAPTFTGVPIAPTAAPATNTTQIATTAYTTAAVAAIPDTLGGQTSAYHLDRTNHTGAQAQSTVTDLVTDLAAKAPLASPSLTGTPTAPTVSIASDSSTKVATTAFVHNVVSSSSSGYYAENGYEVLPSGLKIQWGRNTITATTTTVTFPSAFSSACYSVTCTAYKSGNTGGLGSAAGLNSLPTTTGFVASTASAHDDLLWWAVGK